MEIEIEKKISNKPPGKNKYPQTSWAVWLFPVIALLISIWIAIHHFRQIGPTITILFEDAAGLQAEKTSVRFRGVDIGWLKNVEISTDTKTVIATVSLQKQATAFATEGSRFWIVTPQVSFQGIKGLDTLIEGAYIAALPGKEDSPEKLEFKGLNNSDATDPLENTTVYHLQTSNAESINAGDIISFRGLNVGSVSKVNLSKTSQLVMVQINIQNKFTKLIRTNTHFWRKSGIQANLGLFSSKVKINSLDSILHGGIEIFTPDEAGPLAKPGTRYNLNSDAPKDYEKWNPILE